MKKQASCSLALVAIVVATLLPTGKSSFLRANLQGGGSEGSDVAANRINGGNATAPGEYGFFAQRWKGSLDGKFTYCGGSLIASKWILTAAHCAGPWSRPTWRVGGWCNEEEGVDSHNCGAKFRFRQTKRVIRHPQYYSLYELRDYALVELPKAIYDVKPVDLDDGSVYDNLVKGQPLRGIGMGKTRDLQPHEENDAANSPKYLQHVDTDFLPLDDCRRFWSAGSQFDDSIMCTTGENRGQCWGDSGSPVMVPRPQHRSGWVQVGITSFGGAKCANHNVPDGAARIATAYEWIRNTVCPTYKGPRRTEIKHIPDFCRNWKYTAARE